MRHWLEHATKARFAITRLCPLLLALAIVLSLACTAAGQAAGDSPSEGDSEASSEDGRRPLVEGRVEPLELVADRWTFPDANSVVWSSGPISRSGSSYLILYFDQVVDRSEVPYTLRIVGPSGRVLETIDRQVLSRSGTVPSKILPVDTVVVEVTAEGRPSGLSFRIAEVGFEARGFAARSIYGRPNFEPLYEVDDEGIERSARAVAKLHLRLDDRLPVCTGFLIDAKHLLTNYHCLPERGRCETTLALFGYEKTSENVTSPGESFRCRRLVDHDETIDAALLELEGEPGETWGWLPLASEDPGQGRKLVMIQHPGGRPKEVVRESCRVKPARAPGRVRESDFGHRCDCEDGSSGSPVLDRASYEVVGLHHWGFTRIGYWKNRNRAVRIEELNDFVQAALAKAARPDGDPAEPVRPADEPTTDDNHP